MQFLKVFWKTNALYRKRIKVLVEFENIDYKENENFFLYSIHK